MPKAQLPIANGFYQTDSKPISAQDAVNVYPVVEEAASLVPESLRGCPGVRAVMLSSGVYPDEEPTTPGDGEEGGGDTGGGDTGGGDTGGGDTGDGDPPPEYECVPYACDAYDAFLENIFAADRFDSTYGVDSPLTFPSISGVEIAYQDTTGAPSGSASAEVVQTDFDLTRWVDTPLNSFTADQTGWTLCAGTMTRCMQVRTFPVTDNWANAGAYITGQYNDASAQGICGILGVSDYGGNLFQANAYLTYDRLNNDTLNQQMETIKRSISGWASIAQNGSSGATLTITAGTNAAGLGTESVTVNLPDGTFYDHSDVYTMRFRPWHVSVSFGNFRAIESVSQGAPYYDLVVDVSINARVYNTTNSQTLTVFVEKGLQWQLNGLPDPDPIIDSSSFEATPTGYGITEFYDGEPPAVMYGSFYGYVPTLALGGALTDAQLAEYFVSYERNFEDYVVPEGCP